MARIRNASATAEDKEYDRRDSSLLKSGYFFSHRDLDWILHKKASSESFYLYTGRGPSGMVHMGHLIPWIFTKYLQDKFDSKLLFQLTDDEKFLYAQDRTMKDLSTTPTKIYSISLQLDSIPIDQVNREHKTHSASISDCLRSCQAHHIFHGKAEIWVFQLDQYWDDRVSSPTGERLVFFHQSSKAEVCLC